MNEELSTTGTPVTSVTLLDVVNLDWEKSSRSSEPHCKVHIARTSDVAVNDHYNIYRYLEGFITSRPTLFIFTWSRRHYLWNHDH
ncbi:hypothetical protein J6590_074623, partial [Homalodisca vitripennis]